MSASIGIRLGRFVTSVALVAVSLAACAFDGGDNANGGLGGTSWTVVAIDGQPTLAEARPTIRFAFEGTLSGTSGCNQFSGPFRTDGDRILVGDLMATKIGCDGPRSAQEQAFLAALSGVTQWRLTDGGAELGGDQVITLRAG